MRTIRGILLNNAGPANILHIFFMAIFFCAFYFKISKLLRKKALEGFRSGSGALEGVSSSLEALEGVSSGLKALEGASSSLKAQEGLLVHPGVG